MKKITKVYTRTGDGGETSLVGGVRELKSSIRVEAYGGVDELNSLVGFLLSGIRDESERSVLYGIQSDLFVIGSHLATDVERLGGRELLESEGRLYRLGEGRVEYIEGCIDRLMSLLPDRHGFVLPGGGRSGSLSHVCRCVCRRVERVMWRLCGESWVGDRELAYINRLSDYFFVLSEWLNYEEGISERCWP